MTTTSKSNSQNWTKKLAVPLKAALRYVKYQVKSAPLRYPKLVECNVCGWEGKHLLSDTWHKYSVCPKCRSGVRHRLLFAALKDSDEFSLDAIVRGRRVLHFLPQPVVQDFSKQAASSYVTADYLNPRRDLQIDISDMQSIPDGDFDVLIACDVLEHVEDDRRAMQEISRVLRPGGCAILTVPQQDNLEKTFEDPTVTSKADRERVFGQDDHLRIYGDDFADLLGDSGLETKAVSERDFEESQVKRNVLFPPVLSTHPLATNYRKVFFGVKRAA